MKEILHEADDKCLLLRCHLFCVFIDKSSIVFSPENRTSFIMGQHGIKIVNDSTTLIANRRSFCCQKNTLNNQRWNQYAGVFCQYRQFPFLRRNQVGKKHCQVQDNWKKIFFIRTMIWCLLFQSCKTKMNVFDKQKKNTKSERIEIKVNFLWQKTNTSGEGRTKMKKQYLEIFLTQET